MAKRTRTPLSEEIDQRQVSVGCFFKLQGDVVSVETIFNDGEVVVESLDKATKKRVTLNELSPIPISDSFLLKNGFVYEDIRFLEYVVDRDHYIRLFYNKHMTLRVQTFHACFNLSVRFVHQLQSTIRFSLIDIDFTI